MKKPASFQPGERLLSSQGLQGQGLVIPAALAGALHLVIASALQGLGGLSAASAPEPPVVTLVTLPPAPLPPAPPTPPKSANVAEAAPDPSLATTEPQAAVPAEAPPAPDPEPPSHAAEKQAAPPRVKAPNHPRHPALAQSAPAQPKPAPAAGPVAPADVRGPLQAPARTSALPSGDAAEASFEGRMLQAVQAEARRSYPAAARLMGATGQAAIAFEYRDGSVRVTSIAQSSGFPALDRAAVAAVQNASYPVPPAELVGRTLAKIVHVKFELTAE